MRGHAHAARDVGPDADARAAEGEERGFSARGAPRGVGCVVGVGGAAPDVVGGFEGEEGDGEVGLDEGDGAWGGGVSKCVWYMR